MSGVQRAITRALKLSPQMSKFIGRETASRPEIVKAVYAYAKQNNLQVPENKRRLRTDETLRSIFSGATELDFGLIARGIKSHVTDETPKAPKTPSSRSRSNSPQKN
eukprot:TRINITY_DN1592_c0_g1_i4.p1 TRINITY_DN1592_c0_g1~~TRINITY_DN1592_c0_g1_i4.p1  ORF type:complete len:107 (+),score=23.50 TRINITY_DN1592_c0_g1_i4:117-437(+)